MLSGGGYPLVVKRGKLENGPFIGNFPFETCISRGFSIAMFDYRRVCIILASTEVSDVESVAKFMANFRPINDGNWDGVTSPK